MALVTSTIQDRTVSDHDRFLPQLQALDDRHHELEAMLSDQEVIADQARYQPLLREHAQLTEIVTAHREERELTADLEAAREMAASDADDADLMAAEAADIEQRLGALRARLRLLLAPKDPDDDRDVIVEIRAAAGGDEAGLFAGELKDMYLRYAQSRGWRVEILDESPQDIGGVKETILEITGDEVFGHLKHESGVHRVQRVPATESQGRIHTSTASVAVMTAAEEVDVEVDPNDIRMDVFRSSGPGGQSVNTTDSAVRITHVPTGLVVSCQDQKSQHQNRDKAMRILRSRLLQVEQERAAAERADARRVQIGTGDRSEKIRTYNIPQSRVTDHRIGLTLHSVSDVLAGNLDPMIQSLREAEREARLLGDGTP
jgi:peptide chain release factor 1